MIKYLGSKRALTGWIKEVAAVLAAHHPIQRVVDLFAGSCRVAHALKAHGFSVLANDHNTYAFVLAQALVQADRRNYPPERVLPLLDWLMGLPPQTGWFTETYCERARYFHPDNGARIEAMRNAIEAEVSEPLLKAILLTSLMLAADRVDSTTGIQMAYLKEWAPRALRPIHLRYPPLLEGEGIATQADALELAEQMRADLFYLDPPYNQHSYLANYHVWETLVMWDQPDTYGVAQKRADVPKRKSVFNARATAHQALQALIDRIDSRHLLLSFNDEGFFTREEIATMLENRGGYWLCLKRPYRRYVGALIGIYNPKGEKVGRVSHTRNHEFLFIATHDKQAYRTLRERFVKPYDSPHTITSS